MGERTSTARVRTVSGVLGLSSVRGGWLRPNSFIVVLFCLGAVVGCSPGERAIIDAGPPDTGVVDTGVPDTGLPDTGVDSGVDAGPPPEMVGLCETCAVDEECGAGALCAPLSSEELVCLRRCQQEFNDCPRGFQCAQYAPVGLQTVCLPVGEICCIDEDADGFGIGGQCMGPDCDDMDIDRNPNAAELCDGADQDCDDAIDEMFTDCGVQRCEGLGDGYAQYGDSGCEAGACVDPMGMECGLYTCDMAGTEGDYCATTCEVAAEDRDDHCVLAAHCDGGACEADYVDGSGCDEDSDCESNYCDNGFCCGTGLTCCGVDMDCPGYPGIGTVCDTPTDCQGTRGDVQCNPTMFACETISGVDDDSACGATTLADECGFFRDIYCNGEMDQPRPRCPSTCTSDSECDDNAHCDSSVCFPDLPNGDACDENSDCQSGHCQNGFCCDSGDCCRASSDCPGSYSTAATCDDTRGCQGTRDAASCTDSRCGTTMDVPDDSACTSFVVADLCGYYPSVSCTGAIDQSAPACAMTCSSDSDCDENAHCDGGLCVPDLPNGQACDETSDCISGYCANGFCCNSGDCCAMASDCPGSYDVASVCTSPSQCQGQRRDAVCNAGSYSCEIGAFIDDDSGCAGLISNVCGLFPSVTCTSAQTQPSDQAALCDMSCIADSECDTGAYCDGSTCAAEGNQGDPCTASNQCSGTLACVDGVCCNSACTGSCEACNVAGSLGTCSPIPSGQDPAGECGALSCSSYFYGWSGDTCRERASAPASAVSCNGARACQTAGDVCPSQSAGATRTTCDATCQNPRSGTCNGTSSPVCDNVSAGTVSCGRGACLRTVDRCVRGSVNTCVPGVSSAEICNDIDDDCNGATDDGLGGDGYESNNSCSEYEVLSSIGTDSGSLPTSRTITATLYPNGDSDYYRIYVAEQGGSDCVIACGTSGERSNLTIQINVPRGAGSFELCGRKNSCGTSYSDCVTVAGGNTGSITVAGDGHPCACWPWDSGCTNNNSENFYVRVRGLASPAWDCESYTLSYSGEEVCD